MKIAKSAGLAASPIESILLKLEAELITLEVFKTLTPNELATKRKLPLGFVKSTCHITSLLFLLIVN